MLIPVFVSAPSTENLSPEQKLVYDAVIAALDDLGLEERRLGQSDYPDEAPLKEVIQISRRCSGGIVLGFTQTLVQAGIAKPGVRDTPLSNVPMPTPWNHLEAGILFSLRLPVLVFREPGITGGIFDEGVTDVFVHKMPTVADFGKKRSPVRQVLMKWQAKVRGHYYEWEG
ncbi:hypothetical protein [Bradyrhizobium sp. 21]|uniref:hypothetical protein n=1 Tax=Bradyrhizobium sp. 21 TaxID=2782666 RepID=UPI001FFB3342|nr:hypothetical protein [Bradyrhizobium sp. 21]MCK1383922.1 hypothetical protein [Bradyrhizobium sp. 21]